MDKDEEAQSTGWSSSFFKQTTSFHTPQPSIVSTKEGSGSQLERLQNHVASIIKGISSPPEMRIRPYNPELLTCQKRQWAKFQLQSLDHKVWKEPSKLFESMVIVGIPPTADTQALQNLYTSKMFGGSSRFQSVLSDRYQSLENPNLEPQVLFVYPPEKQLPLKYKDLLLFCFPSGVQVNAVERTQSMSELNEIFLGQEHHKPSESSFVFRLQVADDSTLYGCCVLVEEIIQKPSTLISMILHGQPLFSNLGRHIFTTHRCYCILSRLPFFDLHFGVLNSILTEERFERLTKQINYLDLESPRHSLVEDGGNTQNRTTEASQSSTLCTLSETQPNYISHFEQKSLEGNDYSKKDAGSNYHVPQAPETDMGASYSGETAAKSSVDHNLTSKELSDKCVPKAVLPFIQFQQGESSESSSSFQCSPSQDQLFRNNVDETTKDDELSAGQDIVSDHSDILDWAKANNHGSLQLICEYYRLHCLSHGSTIRFQPLDHLNPLEYSRPNETVLRIAGSRVDLRSYNSSLELAEAHNELMAEEEAAALSVWAVSCLCGTLRLEHVLTLFSGALLEKQIVVVCSNLGVLSALVLSIIPLIRPYHWQSLLMPILPHDMLDFLDAPVPYVVGVQNRTDEMQSKLTNVILVDANRKQVKSPAIPQLPRHRELYSRLNAYHAKLVGESYLAKRRRVYECTDVQVEAAKGFLRLLHAYLDSLCSNLRSHTITNVQSNDDKVSLLLKESFIGSFPRRDQPFMKLFVDTQLFSVHTDLVLSVYQKE